MRGAGTLGKRVGYGWLYSWYAVDDARGLAPYAGDDGLRLVIIPTWSSSLSYDVDDKVSHNGAIWVCILSTSPGDEPEFGSLFWEEVPVITKGTHPYSEDSVILDGSDYYEFYDWHIPTDAQWTELETHIGASPGGKLKSTRNEWGTTNVGATDQYGFSALPAGYRKGSDGVFEAQRIWGVFWSRSEASSSNAWARVLSRLNADSSKFETSKRAGVSLRCVQTKTSSESNGDSGTVTDIEGDIYPWVVIGNYRWTVENLRVRQYRNGNTIPNITVDNDWLNTSSGARCAYNNDEYFVYPPKR